MRSQVDEPMMMRGMNFRMCRTEVQRCAKVSFTYAHEIETGGCDLLEQFMAALFIANLPASDSSGVYLTFADCRRDRVSYERLSHVQAKSGNVSANENAQDVFSIN
jgi:hypothetical protein